MLSASPHPPQQEWAGTQYSRLCSATVVGLEPGAAYTFRVRGLNADGAGDWSGESDECETGACTARSFTTATAAPNHEARHQRAVCVSAQAPIPDPPAAGLADAHTKHRTGTPHALHYQSRKHECEHKRHIT